MDKQKILDVLDTVLLKLEALVEAANAGAPPADVAAALTTLITTANKQLESQ